MKCTVCGRKFLPTKDIVYVAVETKREGLFTTTLQVDCLDCPYCGRQRMLGVRMPRKGEKSDES